MNENFLLRCVQVTNLASRGLNLKYFRELATSIITALNCELGRIEIVVVTPEYNDLSITQSLVKYSGTLTELKVGETEETWRKNYEHQLVKIVHFEKTR